MNPIISHTRAPGPNSSLAKKICFPIGFEIIDIANIFYYLRNSSVGMCGTDSAPRNALGTPSVASGFIKNQWIQKRTLSTLVFTTAHYTKFILFITQLLWTIFFEKNSLSIQSQPRYGNWNPLVNADGSRKKRSWRHGESSEKSPNIIAGVRTPTVRAYPTVSFSLFPTRQ